MRIKFGLGGLAAALILLGAGCTQNTAVKNTAPGAEDTSNKQPKICGQNINCANEILKTCQKGTFSSPGNKTAGADFEVIRKSGSKCIVKATLTVTPALANYYDKYDKNKDGKVDMLCDIPLGQNYSQLTASVGQSMEICAGEWKDALDDIMKQM